MSKIIQKIQENEELLIKIRHHLHKHPELSSREYETAEYIRSFLDEWGIPYVTNGESSTIAAINGSKKGKTIALRGDIDALPITEKTGLPWASVNPGVMHACGHDVHTTFMLAAAKILNELKDEIPGTVKIIFQEGEEIGAGAKKIMAENLLEGTDTIAALHMSQEVDLGKFTLGYKTMSSFGAGGTLTVRAEKDSPDNPILIAGQFVSLVTSLAAQRFSKEEQIVLVPTVVKTQTDEGGRPVEVSVSYNSRTLNFDNEKTMQEVLETAADSIQKIYNCRTELTLRGPGNVVNNDPYFTDLAASVIRERFGEDAAVFSRPVMSGEDFALYQKTIPGVFIHIGGAVNKEYRALHTDKTYPDDAILQKGTDFLIHYVFKYFAQD